MIVTFLHWDLYVGYIRLESFGGLENDFAWRKYLTLRRLMSYIYIYGAPILDVSRSHTTTQHSR